MVPVKERKILLQQRLKVRMLLLNQLELVLGQPLDGVQGRGGLLQRALREEGRDFPLNSDGVALHRVLSETLPARAADGAGRG